MKCPSREAQDLQRRVIFFFALGLLILVSTTQPLTADEVTQGGWRVQVEEGKSTRSALTIKNRCSAPHLFRVRKSPKFVRFEQPAESVLIQPGSTRQLAARFDASGLKNRVYRETVVVECVDCKKERGCSQDRSDLQVELSVVKAGHIAAPGEAGSLSGRVVDPSGNPVVGARVSASGRDAVLTDGRGAFIIRGLATAGRLPVSVSVRGFMETTRIYEAGQSFRGVNTIVVWPRVAPASLDAVRGGKLTFPGGTVSFPPRALVDEAGRPLRGEVKVSFSSFDVSDRRQVRAAPGDFIARMRNNRIRQLETFGVFEVFVEDSEGRRANLAKGRKAAIELFIPPALRRRAPRRVGLYGFDRSSGLWLEYGSLELIPIRPSYNGIIDNISIPSWNADMPLDTTCITLKILKEDGTPAPVGTRVEAEGVDYMGTSPTAYVNNATTGEVCLSVKKCPGAVRVVAYDANSSAINSCPVRIQTPCQTASAADCGNPVNCPLQPEEIILPGTTPGTFYSDLNADDPGNWQRANNWTNWTNSPTNNFYDVWWDYNHVIFNNDGIMRLRLDQTPPPPSNDVHYMSGEYRTLNAYGYGTYEVCMKAAGGDGLMSSFFTYTGPTPHHEIDVEFRGHNTWDMWANFFYDNTDHAQVVPLGFDAAQDFHRYKFVWTPTDITWYVDGVQKHAVSAPNYPQWPTMPGQIMMNLWCGNSNSNGWLWPFSPSQIPVTAEYDWVRYKP
jgi:hypothetical protein